jgi:hypothetical protein
MVTTLCTGLVIVHNLRQAVVMDRKIVAKHYMLHGTFIIDILATAPLWVEVWTMLSIKATVKVVAAGCTTGNCSSAHAACNSRMSGEVS